MQNWKDLYLELSETIASKVPSVRWVDIWHNQVNFLSEEHPFPSPAAFLSFRILGVNDIGLKTQSVSLQVDVYVFYETFADTYRGAVNQDSALDFIDILNDVYAALHGSSGTNFSEMRRTGLSPVDTGDAGNVYVQNFQCTLIDYAAQKHFIDGTVDGISLENNKGPEPTIDPEPLYRIEI